MSLRAHEAIVVRAPFEQACCMSTYLASALPWPQCRLRQPSIACSLPSGARSMMAVPIGP